MTLSHTFAGIAWDPDIRGALSVLVGVVVLMGSVYLILATNLASRLGFLVTLAGFFGWMAILGLFWWIAPSETGPGGEIPAWEVEEINTGGLDQANLAEARGLQDVELPPPEEIDELSEADFEELAASYEDELDGWSLLSPADPSRGEAQTTAEDALAGDAYPGIATQQDYQVLYAMEIGGKPKAESDGMLDRVTNRIASTFRVTHPSHYTIVQVQPAIFQETEPGQPAPSPEANPDAEVISVVLVRNLGEERLPVAVATIVSGLLFGLLCYMLHVRDKTLMANRSAPLPEQPAPTEPERTGAGV